MTRTDRSRLACHVIGLGLLVSAAACSGPRVVNAYYQHGKYLRKVTPVRVGVFYAVDDRAGWPEKAVMRIYGHRDGGAHMWHVEGDMPMSVYSGKVLRQELAAMGMDVSKATAFNRSSDKEDAATLRTLGVERVVFARINYLGFVSPVPLPGGGASPLGLLAPVVGVLPALVLAEVHRQDRLADASAGHAYVDIDLWVADATSGEILWANTARGKRAMPVVEGRVADRIGAMVGQTVHRALNMALWNVSFLEAMGAKVLPPEISAGRPNWQGTGRGSGRGCAPAAVRRRETYDRSLGRAAGAGAGWRGWGSLERDDERVHADQSARVVARIATADVDVPVAAGNDRVALFVARTSEAPARELRPPSAQGHGEHVVAVCALERRRAKTRCVIEVPGQEQAVRGAERDTVRSHGPGSAVAPSPALGARGVEGEHVARQVAGRERSAGKLDGAHELAGDVRTPAAVHCDRVARRVGFRGVRPVPPVLPGMVERGHEPGGTVPRLSGAAAHVELTREVPDHRHVAVAVDRDTVSRSRKKGPLGAASGVSSAHRG